MAPAFQLLSEQVAHCTPEWAAAITGMIGVVGVLVSEQLIPENALAAVLIVNAVLQAGLRMVTSEPIRR